MPLLYLMGDGSYPGMVRADAGGAAILGELYQVPAGLVQVIFEREPPHLYLGKVELEDGSSVWGVLCEQVAVPDKPEITWFGGWRSWRAHEHRLNIRPARPAPGSGCGWR